MKSKKNRSDFEINNITDARFNKLEEKINHAIDTRYDCSLTTIYNEDEILGHEWMYKIEDGHWATAIYNQKTEKFIVKHFRTDENLKVNDSGKRYFDDTEHNREKVYGNKNAKGNIIGMEKTNSIYMPKNKLPTSSPDS